MDPEELLKKNPNIALHASLNSGETNCMEKSDIVTADVSILIL